MLRHKNIDRVCCVILALTVLVSALFVGAAATGRIAENTTIGYETRLFDQSRVHTIDIVMDDWDAFLKTCTSEVYSSCHLVIDGESYKNVGIRGKGNTSLSSVASYGNNRYSFKVEFDQYQNGMTYHGLDKLSLNNLIQDNTYMKDYFAYTLMNKMGVAAPLCSFVQINVNGEPWGLYLAVEGVEDAFLQRNYGKDYGELYKPDSLSFGGGRGNGEDFDMGNFDFSFGGDDENAGSGAQEMPQMPSVDDSFGGSAGGSSGDSAGGSSGSSASTPEPTATATPEPTATPAPTATAAPANDASNGASAGDSAGDAASTGDSAGDAASSGLPAGEVPAMPTDGTMPTDDGASSGAPAGEVPAMPTDGTMPDMSSMPEGFDFSQMGTMSANGERPEMPEGFEMPDMGGFGGFGSSTDVKLQYSDDNPSSYSNIFNNAKTDITAADQKRLIASLKALNEGDVSVVDTDAVIRYMAVHNFLCNDDSYTGMMVHNYYLYEENGVLSMIPWDYNLAYGGFTATSNGTSTVNTTIDRLVSMGSDSDRPMAGWITSSEEYMAQYHEIYQEFMTTVFDSGWFVEEIDRVTAMIDPYVKVDPTSFCTYEEFLTAAETIKGFCLKRAESVSRQLKGDNTRVDASELDLSVMGTMNGIGGGGGPGGFERPGNNADGKKNRENGKTKADSAASDTSTESSPPSFDGMFEMPGMSQRNRTGDAWIWLAACVVLLTVALIAAKSYRTNR